MAHTIRLHRVLTAPPEWVYRAFVQADALCRWMPPHGYTARVEHIDPRVGGTFRMSFTQFRTGQTHHFGGSYRELVPGARLVYTDQFDDPTLVGEIVVTVTLAAVGPGTELHIVQDGVPDAIPAAACYLGWQESLAQLAQLVGVAGNENV